MRVDVFAEFPALIAHVLNSSVLDGRQARDWLQCPEVEMARKACLLNILAVLCVTPAGGDPLIGRLLEVFTAKVERVYGVFDGSLQGILERLVADPACPFYRDPGEPIPIHRELLAAIPARLQDARFAAPLVSYRGEGRPSPQFVLTAEGHGGITVVDLDLDAYNPLQDVVGFWGHLGELLRGKQQGPTDHLALRAVLARGPAAPWLCYTITAQ